MTVSRIAGDRLQAVEHIVQAHLPEAMEQRPGVLQHHARLLAFV